MDGRLCECPSCPEPTSNSEVKEALVGEFATGWYNLLLGKLLEHSTTLMQRVDQYV